MKYVILCHHEHDNNWSFVGLEDSLEAAEQRITTFEGETTPLKSGIRSSAPTDILSGVPDILSGEDYYLIFPCEDHSKLPTLFLGRNE